MRTESALAAQRGSPVVERLDTPDDLAELYDAHARPLHAYLSRRVGATVADDLVAEAFLVLWEQRHTFDPTRAGAHAAVGRGGGGRARWTDGRRRRRVRHGLGARGPAGGALPGLGPAARPERVRPGGEPGRADRRRVARGGRAAGAGDRRRPASGRFLG
ncbi:MAG: sigma-70 family RNA polymerase sigma factor [Saccharothrix sp.]|nr:sigma-70 family RNA polymerase sigma factor [Saccharothrix sp.]